MKVEDSSGKAITDQNNIAQINRIRYRGYYWDAESSLYYCMSRYYDPGTGRWISADGAVSGVGGSILGYNLYAYCVNNPVMLGDPTGNWWSLSTVLLTVAVVLVVAAVVVVAAPVLLPTIGLTTAAATTVASGLMLLSLAAFTASKVINATEQSSTINPSQSNNQSVYIMRNKETNAVEYVGRTNNPTRRQNEHKNDPKKANLSPLEVKFTGLTLPEARVVEQVLISAYTLENLSNARREIAVNNMDGYRSYINSTKNLFGSTKEDELLNLMGG